MPETPPTPREVLALMADTLRPYMYMSPPQHIDLRELLCNMKFALMEAERALEASPGPRCDASCQYFHPVTDEDEISLPGAGWCPAAGARDRVYESDTSMKFVLPRDGYLCANYLPVAPEANIEGID